MYILLLNRYPWCLYTRKYTSANAVNQYKSQNADFLHCQEEISRNVIAHQKIGITEYTVQVSLRWRITRIYTFLDSYIFHGNHITTLEAKRVYKVWVGMGVIMQHNNWNIGPTKANLNGKQKHIAIKVKTKPKSCLCLLSLLIKSTP